MTQNAKSGTFQIACTSTSPEDAGMGKIASSFIQKESVPVPAPGRVLDHQGARNLPEVRDPGVLTHGVPSLQRVLATQGTLKIPSAPGDPGGQEALAKTRNLRKIRDRSHAEKIKRVPQLAWSLQRLYQEMSHVLGETSGAS